MPLPSVSVFSIFRSSLLSSKAHVQSFESLEKFNRVYPHARTERLDEEKPHIYRVSERVIAIYLPRPCVVFYNLDTNQSACFDRYDVFNVWQKNELACFGLPFNLGDWPISCSRELFGAEQIGSTLIAWNNRDVPDFLTSEKLLLSICGQVASDLQIDFFPGSLPVSTSPLLYSSPLILEALDVKGWRFELYPFGGPVNLMVCDQTSSSRFPFSLDFERFEDQLYEVFELFLKGENYVQRFRNISTLQAHWGGGR